MYIMIVYSLAIHYAAPLSTGPLTAAVRARTSRIRYLFKHSCPNDSCNTPYTGLAGSPPVSRVGHRFARVTLFVIVKAEALTSVTVL